MNISDSDLHFFRLARECSLQSDYSGSARLGCVVVYKRCILAKGSNRDKTHTMQARYNVLRYKNIGNRYLPDKVHSELDTISKIKYLDIDFSRVQVYIYRELRDGTIANSRPCCACMAAIKDMGIKTIKYSTEYGYCTEKLF